MFFNKNHSNNHNDSIGIIGLGRFGMALAKRLCDLKREVIVLDQNESKIKEIKNYTEFCFVVDDFSKETLMEAGLHNCSVIVVCIGEKMDASILAAVNAVSLNVPKVIAKAISAEHGLVLEKIGAEVVYPEHDMAIRLAKRIVSNDVLDYMALNGEFEISELKIPTALEGVTILDSKIRTKFGLNIIAIKRNQQIIIDFDANFTFTANDKIVVIGKYQNITKFEASYL